MSGGFKQSLHILLTSAFFLLVLAAGWAIHDDYGNNWDLKAQVDIGIANFDYITGDNQFLLEFKDRYYGPVFEVLLYAITRRMEPQRMMLVRYQLTFFLFWLGLIALACLARRISKRWYFTLVAPVLLLLSPRILGDAFYNSKDIPFMAMFIISILTLVRFAEKPSLVNTIAHALATALLIAIRVPGLMIAAMTMLYIPLTRLTKASRANLKGVFSLLAFYLVLTAVLTVLFWPILWHDPLNGFITALRQMSNYPWLGQTLYKGVIITGQVPWTYAPTWILITTPVILLAWAVIGGLALLKTLPRAGFSDKTAFILLTLFWFAAPLALVILLHSTLYDGFRQLYFIYPALVLIAVFGMEEALNLAHRKPAVTAAIIAVTLLGLLQPAIHILQSHPDEAIYFNAFAGRSMSQVKQRYDLDYWGISYREGLEWVAAHDERPAIKVKFAGNEPGPGYANSLLLADAQRRRIEITDAIEEADYFMTNYRLHPEPYEFDREAFSVIIGDASIMTVYRLK